MPEPIVVHVAALRRQVRRLHRVAAAATGIALAAIAVLAGTAPAGGLGLLLVAGSAGYLYRLGRLSLRTRRGIKQLRLEEQFLRHGPNPAELRSCLWSRDHLWTRSLTLRGLKALSEAPAPRRPIQARRTQLRRHYRRAYRAIRPGRIPVNLLWLAALLLLWVWTLPEALSSTTAPLLLAGAGLLLVVLAAEVLVAVLQADVHDGMEHFTTLLVNWTLAHRFEETLRTTQKHYRHTPLYRAATPALSPAA